MPIFRSNRQLLQRFRAGERDALASVYDAYVEKVDRLVRRGCQVFKAGGEFGGEVQVNAQDYLDLSQEVFVKAFSTSGRQGYDGIRDYEPYLLMIARNAMIDWLRRRRATVPLSPQMLEALTAEQAAAAEPLPWEDPETLAVLKQLLSTLPPDMTALHRCRYVDGMSQEKAARALGISRQNLRTLEQALRTSLARALAAQTAAGRMPTQVNLRTRTAESGYMGKVPAS